VVVDSDPERLLEKLRAANRGREVHLVGGPRTNPDTELKLESQRALPGGSVEIVYAL
jgi:hypothetical protein